MSRAATSNPGCVCLVTSGVVVRLAEHLSVRRRGLLYHLGMLREDLMYHSRLLEQCKLQAFSLGRLEASWVVKQFDSKVKVR